MIFSDLCSAEHRHFGKKYRSSGALVNEVAVGGRCEAQPSPPCPAPSTLTPENLYDIAGDGLRMMVDARREQSRPLRERDIIEASWRLLPLLDIHPSVWFEGQSALGDHGLALCLLLVDAGRDHSTYPVRNPGGFMREMVRRAKAGRLGVDASITALRRRRTGVNFAGNSFRKMAH